MKPKAKPSRAAVARQLAERVRDSTRDGAEIVEHLLRIMRSDDVAASDRIKAATTLLDRGYGRATEHVTISAGDQAESAVARMADAALEALLAGMRTVEGEVVRPGDLGPQISDGLAPSHPQISEGLTTPTEALGSSEHAEAEIVATDPIEDVALSPVLPGGLATHDLPPPVRLTPCQSEGNGLLERETGDRGLNPSRTLSRALDQDRDGRGAGGGADVGADVGAGGGADRAVETSRGPAGGANPCPPAEGRPGAPK